VNCLYGGQQGQHDWPGRDTFSWNALNQLTSETVGGTTTSMTSNGDGLRQTRTSGATTSYTWDVAGLPVILDDGTYDYVYGAGPGPLARIAKVGGATQYFLADGLGSTVALTDSSGTVVQTYSYDAFGAPTGSGTAPTEFQFAGQQTDPSGLQYLRARYYDPGTGRFLSRDTALGGLDQPQSLSRFAYAQGNPVTLIDPSGRLGCGICGAVVSNLVDNSLQIFVVDASVFAGGVGCALSLGAGGPLGVTGCVGAGLAAAAAIAAASQIQPF
jgi:RHS repeat-associated protein